MRHSAIASAALTLLLVMGGSALASDKVHNSLIFKVDSVSARVSGHKLVISAKGAVSSGGWENPHLHLVSRHDGENGKLTVEFLASPPAKDAAVIQALLPVSTTTTIPLAGRKATTVTVTAQSNAVTTEIQSTN